MSKAQVSIEHLTTFGGFLVIVIPLSLLFITLTSINSEDLKTKELSNAMNTLSREVEVAYSLCGEQEVKRKVSLRIPDNVENIDFVVDPSIKSTFLVFDLKGGDSVIKELLIPCNSQTSLKACQAGRAEVVFNTKNLDNFNGNRVFLISCKEVSGASNILLEGLR